LQRVNRYETADASSDPAFFRSNASQRKIFPVRKIFSNFTAKIQDNNERKKFHQNTVSEECLSRRLIARMPNYYR
jgi:hypothetical protein